MRVIERKIIDGLKGGKQGTLSVRDWIGNTTFGSVFRLWGTTVAVYNKEQGTLWLGVVNGAWQTKTTKSRINAIASAFNTPAVYSKRGRWMWTDGKPYEDSRLFSLKDGRAMDEKEAAFFRAIRGIS